MTPEEIRKNIIQSIQDVGEDLIRDADSYITNDDVQQLTSFSIRIDISVDDSCLPTIGVLKTYISETAKSRLYETKHSDNDCSDACGLTFTVVADEDKRTINLHNYGAL